MDRNFLVLLMFLAPSIAGASPPKMYQVPEGYLIPENGWVMNDDGYDRLKASLDRQHGELITLRAENSSLQQSLKEMEEKPALTVKGALLFVAIGLVAGSLLVGVPLILRK